MAAEVGYLEETFKKISFVCHLSGIDLENKKNNYKQKIVYTINFLWINTDLVGAICYVIFGVLRGKDFIELTYSGPCVTFTFLANFKSLPIILNGDKLQNLFNTLKKLEKEHKEEKYSARQQIIQEEVNLLHGLLRFLDVSFVFVVIGFSFNPGAVTAYKYFVQDVVDLRLPLFILYPFDAYDIKYWPFVYIRQIWSSVVAVAWVAVGDYIFYICCSYIRIQFRLLEHDLEKVITAETTNGEFQNRFRKLVVWHQELINCSHMLEDTYAITTLYNFVSSSVIICLTGFDVMMISDTLLVITFVAFLAANLFQIFFLCFFGDLLMRASMDVSNGAYNSLWYLKNASVGKSLLPILIRSQEGCKLTAFDFADVNLLAFTGILGNAWSYFALLNTLMDNASS